LSVVEYLEFFLQAYQKEIDMKKIDETLKKLQLEDKKHSVMR
jgi:ABC-type multidrug transport system ATPase subunit